MTGRVLLAVACGALVVAGTPASADAPSRTAWFSAASAGGLVLPAPTLAEGDLRVAGTGERPTAYATLALPASGTAGGELVLAVRSGSLGTVELAACPTKASDWEAGGNQPFDAGPGYDCAAGVVFGSLSADGTSVSFLLDSSLPAAVGTTSVALAPLPEAAAPFSIDLGDPVFTPADGPGPDDPGPAEPVPADPAPAPAAGGDAPAPAPVDEPVPPPLQAPDPAPAPDLGTEPAPALPGTVSEDPPAAPLTAADPGTVPAPPVLPGATLAADSAAAPAGPRLLALLALVGVSAGAGYAAGQQRPAPRLLGGRARALPPGGTPTAGTLVVRAEPTELARGIGRFSRVRDAAPRRLR